MNAAPHTDPIEVFVYHDFASSLSYVADRVLARIEGELAAERIEMRWKAIDLTGIGHFRRGRLLPQERRASLVAVASALDVPLVPPVRWLDSRLAGEVAVTLDLAIDRGLDPAVEREWRRRAFEAFHGPQSLAGALAGGVFDADDHEDRVEAEIEALFAEFERRGHFGRRGVASLDELARGRRLVAATESALAAGVEGAPTLMFDVFPLCGIHDQATMLGMIRRYARRRRLLESEGTVEVN